MKSYFFALVFFASCMLGFAQEEKSLGVFESDSTWLSEIIKFPLQFAPEIAYTGYEDLRFAKKWRDETSSDFWCYMFAWHITNGNEKQTVEKLEANIKLYYDGLMAAVNKKKDFKVPETKVRFFKNDSDNAMSDFTGTIDMYDSFNKEAMITLNVTVKNHYCEIKKQSTIVFKLSPKDFKHDIWTKFEGVKLRNDICDN